MKPAQKILCALVFAAALGATDAQAVYLDAGGLGQALIYPYYTTRSVDGNAFHTYLSVVNTTSSSKVVRVRLREGRNGREALNFNLYLAPNDMWTGAVVPEGDGAKMISVDASCTNPPAFTTAVPGLGERPLTSSSYTGANADGKGEELSRVTEGFVEMIEMATLRRGSTPDVAVTHVNGIPDQCALVEGSNVTLAGALEAPTGGLMGTLTLINVASGLDFTVNAEALASLTTQPFYRNFDSPYPDWNAAEVTPVSEVTTGGKRFRMLWARGVDAVSSVLMQSATENEFVLDTSSASRSDWVFTAPTRRFYLTAAGEATAPFSERAEPGRDGFLGCQLAEVSSFDREAQRSQRYYCDSLCPSAPIEYICYAASLWTIQNAAAHMGPVVGSLNPAELNRVTDTFQNGWIRVSPSNVASMTTGLVSLPTSSAVDLRTNVAIAGSFRVLGLPMAGFLMRTFRNGNLNCAASTCQGNYGGAFPHKPMRSIVAVP